MKRYIYLMCVGVLFCSGCTPNPNTKEAYFSVEKKEERQGSDLYVITLHNPNNAFIDGFDLLLSYPAHDAVIETDIQALLQYPLSVDQTIDAQNGLILLQSAGINIPAVQKKRFSFYEFRVEKLGSTSVEIGIADASIREKTPDGVIKEIRKE